MNVVLRAVLLVHRFLLRASPNRLPDGWAEDAHATAREAVAAAARAHGFWRALWVGAAECADVVGQGAGGWARGGTDVWRGMTAGIVPAVRTVVRRPVRAATSILTLAVGIGAATSVFSVVNNTLIRPMLIHDIDRLVRIDDVSADGSQSSNVAPLNAEAFSSIRGLSEIIVQDYRPFVANGQGDPERLRGAGVSAEWLGGLGIEPVLGRAFTADEHRVGEASGSVLIGYGLWQRRWGGAPGAVGATLHLNGRPRTVVGVLPRGFRFPYEAELWVPIDYDPIEGDAHTLLVFGRLASGQSLGDLRAELDVLSVRMAARFPDTNTRISYQAVPLRDNLVRGYDRTALALLSVVGFLLMVGAMNVAGLALAEATVRSREMALRASLGATRWRQAGQLLAEAGLLVAAGTMLGVGMAHVLQPYLALLVPPVMSVELAQNEIVMDRTVYAFVAGIALLATLLVGGLPAARLPVRNPARVLRAGGRGSRGGGGSFGLFGRLGGYGLIAPQLAFAVVLIVGASTVTSSFLNERLRPLGSDPGAVLTLRTSLPEDRYPTSAARSRAARALLTEIERVPRVASVSLSTSNPSLGGWAAIVGRPDAGSGEVGRRANARYVAGDFDRTLGLPVLNGRGLDERDPTGPLAAVVSASLAEALWGERGASLGGRVSLTDPTGEVREWSVVGVVGDLREAGGETATIYLPYEHHIGRFPAQELHLFVRAAPAGPTDPGGSSAGGLDATVLSLATPVRAALRSVDSDVALFGIQAQASVQSPEYVLERTGAVLAVGLVVFGLLLTGMGVFGAVTQVVEAARPSLGVRKALGATSSAVLWAALTPLLVVSGIGVLAGVSGSLLLQGLLGAVFVGLPVPSAGVYALVATVLFTVALAAALRPAVGAALVNPAGVLRGD